MLPAHRFAVPAIAVVFAASLAAQTGVAHAAKASDAGANRIGTSASAAILAALPSD